MSKVQVNIPQQFKDFLARAENNEADGVLEVAKCYFLGKYVPCDLNKAYELFDQAAGLGNKEAKYHVAFCMFYRVGTFEDSYRGRHVNGQAAKAGWAPALLASHMRTEIASHSQIKNAYHQTEKMAMNGDPFAQFRIAVCYERGDLVDKNLQEAFKWFLKSAQSGHVVSMHVVGLMMEEGSGIPKNVKEAVKWFERAGDRGFLDSQEHLKNFMNNKTNPNDPASSSYINTDNRTDSTSSPVSMAWIWSYCNIV